MSIVSAVGLDTVGFIPDRRADLLAPQAFTDAHNIRFKTGGAETIKGEVNMYTTPTVEPYFALQFKKADDTIGWLYCGLSKIYAFKAGTEYNLTRQTASVDVNYNAIATSRWNGGMFNNVVILNNGVDLPQSWTSLDTSVRVQNLANWDANWRAECIRPFKNYLLALDMTESGTHYPTRLRWSHTADPGTVPSSWDSTDVTKDAGETTVGHAFGRLIDAVPLRDSMVLYKEDSVWLLSYIGGTFIFKVTGLFQSFGMPTRDCAVEFKPGQHFVFTGLDLVVHDGQTAQSLLEGRAKNWLTRLDKDKISQCFVVADPTEEEVMFCYPNAEADGYGGLVQEALVWNHRLNVLSYRDLRKTNFITNGFFDASQFTADTWDGASGVWSTDHVPWDVVGSFVGNRQLTYCLATPALAVGNIGNVSDGAAFTVRLEKTGLGFPVKQNQLPDVTSMKFLRAIWPRFAGQSGTELQIRLGWQLAVDQPVQWGTLNNFTVGEDTTINCTISARTFAYRIESSTPVSWNIVSLDFDVQQAGSF